MFGCLMAEPRIERRLAAILAADVVGYSRLMGADELGTFERIRAHRKELFEPEIARHRGRIFKLMGDGLLAEFGSVVDAVNCAVALQRSMLQRNNGISGEHRGSGQGRHRVREWRGTAAEEHRATDPDLPLAAGGSDAPGDGSCPFRRYPGRDNGKRRSETHAGPFPS